MTKEVIFEGEYVVEFNEHMGHLNPRIDKVVEDIEAALDTEYQQACKCMGYLDPVVDEEVIEDIEAALETEYQRAYKCLGHLDPESDEEVIEVIEAALEAEYQRAYPTELKDGLD